jgi:hypothetical protein
MLRKRLSEAVAAAALLAGVAACASPPGGDGAAAGGAGLPGSAPWVRVVTPFEVLDERGEPYSLPFLGGFLAPRPQFVDIDGDGDLDLFVQEYTGRLRFFENVGTARAPSYVWRSDHYQDLDIGEWYRFVDVDGDGLVDLLSEERTSYIRYYRNEGSRTDPRFVRADSLRDTQGRAIFMDRQNIPALVDIDCNGRLDLFVGRVEGTVARYEASRPGSDRFVFLTERWEEIEILGSFGPDALEREAAGDDPRRATRRHGANALAFADFDGDGDLDLFWGDFFEPAVLLIENIGPTCSTPYFRVDPFVLPAESIATSGYNAPVPVDLNGNGELDFLMGVLGGAYNPTRTSADNFYHWERVAPDRLELRTRRFLDGIDVGSESAVTVVDLDGDGTLDLVVGSKIDPGAPDSGVLLVFRNEGSQNAPRLRLTDTLRVADAYNQAPAFADLDGDGVLDLVLGTWSGDVLYFRGDAAGPSGIPRFVQDTARSFRLPRGSNAMPALVDIDGDGDLDLFVGQSNGAIAFYRNEGSATEPRFELVEERMDDLTVGRRSAPAFFDLDGDGLLDLISGREEGGVAVFRNAGTATSPRFVESPGLMPAPALPPMSSPFLADLDGDGVIDLVSGSVSGGVVFWKGAGGRR